MLIPYNSLNKPTQRWLQTLYAGNGPFKLRNMVSTQEVARALEFKTIETRRHDLERTWAPRIYALHQKVGREVARDYADNQNLQHQS